MCSKQKNKSLETNLNETDSDLPYKEFKITMIIMLTEVRRPMHEQSENFNKEKVLKSTTQKYKTEEYNTWSEKFNRGVQQQIKEKKGSENSELYVRPQNKS